MDEKIVTAKKEKAHPRSFFRQLWTMVIMQLKEKSDMSYLRSFRKTLFKVIWLIVEFAVITEICYLILYYVKILGVFSLVSDIPDTVMAIVFTVMMGLSVIFGTAGLVKSLYFSRDNMVLLTYPVKSSTVFLSKLAVYYVHEFRKNFMFIIPLFIAYGGVKAYPGYYYPWLLFLFLFISALPVILSALLSIPFMFVYQWIRKVKFLQYILYLLLASAAVALAIFLISLIPENIDLAATWGTTFWKIQDFLKEFEADFPIMHAFTQLIVGKSTLLAVNVFTTNTGKHLAILIGGTVGLLALTFFSSKPLFYKMASKPFEYAKKANPKAIKNRKRGSFLSAFHKEFTVGIRSNTLITTTVLLVVVMPLAIELLNSLYSAMNTRFLGMQMTVSFNVLVMLLTLLSTNIDIASCYSRDGSTSYLNKVQPAPYVKLLFAKLVPNVVIGFLGTTTTMIVYGRHSDLSFPNLLLMGCSVYFIYVAHLFWSAEMDIMKPQYEQYATFNNQGNNPNENMSAILVFLFSFVMFGISLLLSLENADQVWVKLFVIALILAIAKLSTFLMKISAFYKEK